jgi:hypothetical protein
VLPGVLNGTGESGFWFTRRHLAFYGAEILEVEEKRVQNLPFFTVFIITSEKCILSGVLSKLHTAQPRIHVYIVLSFHMPAKPRWHADLDQIRRSVCALETAFVDRPAIERLFSVKRRQANYLMRTLGGYHIGQATVVGRDALLARLVELSTEPGKQRGYRAQAQRKTRVLEALHEALDEQRSAARPRRISAPPARPPGSPLPEGVRLTAPGELTIVFTTPEDLLGRVMGLAQSAAGDYVAFAAGLEGMSLRSGLERISPEARAEAIPESIEEA